jgi:predicted heme/steroid binding protein
MNVRNLGLIGIAIFIIGAGVILYNGRPVEQMKQHDAAVSQITPDVTIPQTPPSDTPPSNTTPTEVPPSETAPATETPKADGYTLAQVQTHGTQESCWSAVNGQVYDLTTWISRHPGGAQRIIGMCGKDATSSFERMHGKSRAAQAALILLKIGPLN